jgi:hypothetical protein
VTFSIREFHWNRRWCHHLLHTNSSTMAHVMSTKGEHYE